MGVHKGSSPTLYFVKRNSGSQPEATFRDFVDTNHQNTPTRFYKRISPGSSYRGHILQNEKCQANFAGADLIKMLVYKSMIHSWGSRVRNIGSSSKFGRQSKFTTIFCRDMDFLKSQSESYSVARGLYKTIFLLNSLQNDFLDVAETSKRHPTKKVSSKCSPSKQATLINSLQILFCVTPG